MARDAPRIRTRTGLVARHGRGGHAVVVGRPHGHDGDGLRSAARAAHHGGQGDDTGVQAACLVDGSATGEPESIRLETDDESAADRDAGPLEIALRRPESERLRTRRAGQELRHRRGAGRLRSRYHLRDARLGHAGFGVVDAGVEDGVVDSGGVRFGGGSGVGVLYVARRAAAGGDRYVLAAQALRVGCGFVVAGRAVPRAPLGRVTLTGTRKPAGPGMPPPPRPVPAPLLR